MKPPLTSEVFGRDGHLLELAVSRSLCEPVSAAFRRQIDAHVAECSACREVFEAIEEADAAVTLEPPAWLLKAAEGDGPAPATADRSGGQVIELAEGRRRRRWVAAAASLAVAATALFVLVPRGGAPTPEDADQLRRKSSALDLEVYVHDGERARLAADGTIVHEGDRAGFRIWPRRDGHLMIVGVDARQDVYLCYPQRAKGQSTTIKATASPIVVNEAVRFDDQLGAEHLFALICDEPFTLADLAPQLRRAASGATIQEDAPALRAGCVQKRLVLDKRATGGER